MPKLWLLEGIGCCCLRVADDEESVMDQTEACPEWVGDDCECERISSVDGYKIVLVKEEGETDGP